MSLTVKILIGMGAGLLVGFAINAVIFLSGEESQLANNMQYYLVSGVFDTLGQIFVRSLKLLIVPMVFVSLVLGAASLGNSARMGPMALKTIALYLVTTCIAITFALTMALLIKPGVGVDLEVVEYAVNDVPSFKETVINIVPENPVKAMANTVMLQIIVFSILMGIALSRIGEKGQPVLTFFESMNEVVMKMVMMLMQLAPYGVFALLAKTVADLGAGAIEQIIKYFLTMVFVLIVHATVVYPTFLKIFTGLNPVQFFLNIRPTILFAFSTASSNATLPVTMETARDRLGVSRSIASFSLPLGATINMDGTAIMMGVATVFISQVYGIDIGLQGYLLVVLTAMLASIGTAGVPGVGTVMLTMVLGEVGLPAEGIGMILAVDRLLDMVRTAVNVTGDSMVATVVAKTESEIDLKTYRADSTVRA